ncbi:MAG: MFS transporter [Promethearchaeota archaeon]
MGAPLPTKKNRFNKHLIIIFIIMFTEILGFSMVMPVIPFLALSLGLNALQIGLILSMFSICQLFASPITGKLSDRFGRKPILIISQTSTFIGFLLLGIADVVWLLIVARLVDGLIGSNMTVSQAYISDVSKPQDRTRVYGYSSAVFGAGLIFGPVIGGTLSTFSYSIPMFFAAGVSLISIILILIFLPESLEIKVEKLQLKFNDVIPINETKRFFKNSTIRNLIFIFLTYNFGFMLFISTYSLFAQKQLGVSAFEVGLYMTWIGILRVIFQTTLISPLQKRFGENSTLGFGVVTMIITMILLMFSTNYIFIYVPLTFLAFGTGVCRPILTSKLTQKASREETGSLLGVNNAFTSFVQIIAPILGGAIIEYLPSQILPLLSSIIFILLFLQWRFKLIILPTDEKLKIEDSRPL